MGFLQWFHKYSPIFTYGWLIVLVMDSILEIFGFVEKRGTTFTDLVRSTVPIFLRAVILFLVLGWHFVWGKVNYQDGRTFWSFGFPNKAKVQTTIQGGSK